MESAYSIAVSKLESFMGKNMEVKLHADMPADQKRKSLTSIAIGRVVLEGVLKVPTRAVSRFNQGADLLNDWNNINLKERAQTSKVDVEVEPNDDFGDKSSRSKASSSRSREDDTDSNSSPAKKNKGLFEAENVLRQQVSLAEAKCATLTRSTDILLKASNGTITTLTQNISKLEKELTDIKACAERLEQNIGEEQAAHKV